MKVIIPKVVLAVVLGCVLQMTFAGGMPLTILDESHQATKKSNRQQIPKQAQEVDQAVVMQKFGKVLSSHQIGVGGLTAWIMQSPSGQQVVLYTTADGQAVFTGAVWDVATGKNLSDAFLTLASASKQIPQITREPFVAPVDVKRTGALSGLYQGEIPDAMKTVDSLAGVKEGKGGIADTVYIVFDPRCPYCHQAYKKTRLYVKKGFSIKWIPTVALGSPDQGIPMNAAILQAKSTSNQLAALESVMLGGAPGLVKATPSTIAALDKNLEFLNKTFQRNDAGRAGVPAAFFLDHKTGKSRMLKGVSEDVVLQEIFGQ